MWRNYWTAAAPFLRLIAGLKAATAARPDSSRVVRRAKSIERLVVKEEAFGVCPTAGAKPWPAPFRGEGADGAEHS